MMNIKVTSILVLTTAVVAVAVVRAQHPLLDMVANQLVQKYQTSTCEQLWQERIAKQGQPKTPQEQEVVTMLQNNPQMRTEFINKVSAPIVNKLFDCGLIP
jgi:hypothetical protein